MKEKQREAAWRYKGESMENKKRLIDADALVEKLQTDFKRVFTNAGKKVKPEDYYIKRASIFEADRFKCEIDDFCEMVAAQPTVDAVEVVRCKDCKYWEKGKDYEPYCNHYGSGMADTVEDDFCSYGERKDNG